MNILQKTTKKISSFFSKKEETTISTPAPTGYEANTYGAESGLGIKRTEFLEEMKGWVAACVTAISDEVASIQLKLYKVGKNNEIEEIKEHDVLDLLYKVNNFTTKFDHFGLTQNYLELVGEAPWFVERKGKKIDNIFILRPDKLNPIADKTRLISGYDYDVGMGKKIRLSLEDVIFLKNPNPAKPFRGKGALEMAATTVDIDNFSEHWNKNFYENAARPDSILKVNVDNMSDEQKNKLKKSIKTTYEGYKKAHQMMVLFGDMNLEKVGLSQKDMDFLEASKFNMKKIAGIFRVPLAIISQTEGVNFASAKVAQYIFARWCIKPKMERMVQQLNEFLLPLFPNTDNMFLDYVSPVPEDEEAKVKTYESALKSGWMTINEVRQEEGLAELEGGDTIYLPYSLVAMGSTPATEEEPVKGLTYKKGLSMKKIVPSVERFRQMRARSKGYFKKQKQKEGIRNSIKEAISKEFKQKIKEEKADLKMTEDQITAFWILKNIIFKKYLPEVKKGMQDVFYAQAKDTLIKMNSFKDVKLSSDQVYNSIKLDKTKEIQRTLKITLPTLIKLYEEAANETFDMLGVEMSLDVTEPEVAKRLGDMGKAFAGDVTETTNKKIHKELIKGFGAGEAIPDIKERIKKVFMQASDSRAEMIARSETLRYNTTATEEAFVQSEIVEGKQWITNPKPCAQCKSLKGKTAPLGGNFVEKGDVINDVKFDYRDLPAPPLHPNCECDIIPIFKPLKSIGRSKKIKKNILNRYGANNRKDS